MTGWLFTSPDGKTKPVDLPHTWNGKDGQDGGNDYMRDQCTYQKTFAKPAFEAQTECVYLEFAGVNASCRVCLNGKEIATHDGGYSTFQWKSQSNYREKMNWFCTWIIKQATRYILSGRILRFTAGFTGMLQF